MASRSKIVAALAGLYLASFCYSAQAAETKVKYKADNVNYDKGGKKAKLVGNVQVDIDEVKITGQQIDVDFEERIVSTDQQFKITSVKDGKNTEILGKSFNFNIDTKRLIARSASLETDAEAANQKVYITGDEITVYNKGERVTIVDGDFTTCDYTEKGQTPHYSLKAKQMDYLPGDRVIAWNTSVYFGGNKVFWYPLWYFPLKSTGNDFNIDIGKNEVEGLFVNFKNYYNFNDYHDGNYFVKLMEKKWLGLGFEHTWLANPTSASYIFAYGNPANSRYFLEPNATLRENISPVFEDYEIYIRHEQWLPILPYAQTNFSFHDRSFYNINSTLSPRDDYDEYNFTFSDNEIYQPFKNTVINFTPKLDASYARRRDSNTDLGSSRIVQTGQNNELKLSTNTDFKVNDINFNLNSNFSNTIRQSPFGNGSSLTTTPTTINGQPVGTTVPASSENTGANRNLNYYKSTDNTDFSNTLSMNYNILPSLSLNATSIFTNNDNRSFSQPYLPGFDSIQNSGQIFNQRLNSKVNLAQDLGWANLSLLVDHYNDFLEDDIFQKNSLGTIIPDAQLTPQQQEKRNTALTKRKSAGYINKLPELNLRLDPFFQDVFPVTLSTGIGRYLESTTYSLNNTSSRLLDLVRSEVNLSLDQKILDLGLGNKIDFGGSGYQQLFYQTQDAQYKFTGRMNYRNDLFSGFIPTLNYNKVITDDQNNTPFSFDRFSRDRQDNLIGGLTIGNTPAFTMNFNNIGYDYQNKSYFSPSLGINSDFVAGARFNFTMQTSYNVNNVKKENLTRVNTNLTTGQANYIDKSHLKADIVRADITDTAFANKYAGYSRDEALRDVNSLSDTDLSKKYGIDNRLYDLNGKNVLSNERLTEDDIGRLELRGGKLSPISLSFGVGTPWDFGADSDFGKGENIPWGIAGLFTTAFDVQGDDYYKPKEINGIKQPLTDFQSYTNLLQKFSSNTSLGALFVIGGNWLTHTNIELNLTLIPPELVAEGSVPLQTNRPSFPFNTTLSIKKDLHDFILSFDFQNQYVPQYNKRDFMFSLNLELTAFPFSTKDLTSQASQNLNGLNNLTNQIR